MLRNIDLTAVAALLLFSVLLSTQTPASGSSVDGHWLVGGANVEHSLSRSLHQNDQVLPPSSNQDSLIPQYLIPTRDETTCTGADCCNSNWQASPYWVQQLQSINHTVGAQQFTTFYLSLHGDSAGCLSNSVSAEDSHCCAFNITKIWLDVDPMLKVQYASLDGQTSNFLSIQNNEGFSLIPNMGALLHVPAEGMLMTITVALTGQSLCNAPDYAIGSPIKGVCQLIVTGNPPHEDNSKFNSCCPFGLSKPVQPDNGFLPVAPSCSSALSGSPYKLILQSVSPPVEQPGSFSTVTYSFSLMSNSSNCNRKAINQCCDMSLDRLSINIVSGSVIARVTVGNIPWTQFALDNSQSSMTSLILSGLDITHDTLPASGRSVVLVVKVPTGTTQSPDICSSSNSGQSVGSCVYSLHSIASMCCPSSTTTPVQLRQPLPPSSACNPSKVVALEDTSMGFSYFSGPIVSSPTMTKFSFLVANNNKPTTTCSKLYCQNVCSWELFLAPEILPFITFEFNDPSSNGLQTINFQTGSVTFLNVPTSGHLMNYTIVVNKNGMTLDTLCSKSAMPHQVKSCAAVLRNSAVMSKIQFGQSDVKPPGPTPDGCNIVKPLPDSCIRVDEAGFNSHTGTTTTVDFKVVNHDGEPGCTPEKDQYSPTQFQVLLQTNIVSELQASNAIVPTWVEFSSNSTITWAYTPVDSGAYMHYQINVAGNITPSSICQQNVVPGQVPNSCVVVFIGSSTCYMGPVIVLEDQNLQPIITPVDKSSSGPAASVIVPAIIVPIAVLAILLLLFVLLRNKRGSFNTRWFNLGSPAAAAETASSTNDLAAPLSAARVSDHGSVSERSGSDIFVRLPSSTAVDN